MSDIPAESVGDETINPTAIFVGDLHNLHSNKISTSQLSLVKPLVTLGNDHHRYGAARQLESQLKFTAFGNKMMTVKVNLRQHQGEPAGANIPSVAFEYVLSRQAVAFRISAN